MAVLTFQSSEYNTFPPILREYASYQNSISGKGEKTVCEYLLDLRTFFRYMRAKKEGALRDADFEEISITSLSREEAAAVRQSDIIEFLMYVGSFRENSTTTRMRKLSSLRSFYHFMCAKRHYMDVDPTTDIDGMKPKKALPKFLSLEESIKLLQTVRDDKSSPTRIRDYTMICLFLNTGMRLSELVGLNLTSLDTNLEKVKVLGKGKKERMIYLNDAVKKALAEYLPVRLDPTHVRTSDKALFLSRLEERISPKTVQHIVYKYLDRAGLGNRGLSVHKLRHTAATLLFQTGEVDIRVLKEILGHEQLNTTQIYTHVVNQNLKDAMQKNPLSDLQKSIETDD